ncbi:N-acetyl-beta-glucosaminidase [Legionella geestiana]|uniref:N-acetyl-beta-glucosaminidase n=1 Tax=Legionella geestiana TaxID=45065 RepID=A0A0W0UAK9_9GAMM|nr:glycoside hydrolase family 3 N-terminal domain-containing protein [Legionella geestiana]KTD04831.1 N-acetyl-beta-glucosaminidase [Legionella geestiana]QBS11339.1 glycoside hydrolase family 3 protein [Legionella geestiana]STX54010.1 N-acetyl-beta-glucosaminidase [Legionella geestiana]
MKRLLMIFCALALFSSNMYAQLSLRDKIGQMLIIGFDGKTVSRDSQIVKDIQNDNLGGVILFDVDVRTKRRGKNIESQEQVKRLNHDLQCAATAASLAHRRPLLPLIISIDYEGGQVNRLNPVYGFPEVPPAKAVGQSGKTSAKAAANTMADVLKEAGFNLNLMPVVDVDVNPNNPIIGRLERSFSKDPNDVAMFAHLYAKALRNNGIQCVYKHFPGHGSSTADSHLDFVDVTDSWKSLELTPYRILLQEKDGCGAIMSAHAVNRQLDKSGTPATLSHTILTELLRKKLGFNGVIMTDDMQMKAISAHYGLENAITMAINAGADMLIFGNNLLEKPQTPEALIDIIASRVESGDIPRQRIEEVWKRIEAFKKTLKPMLPSDCET